MAPAKMSPAPFSASWKIDAHRLPDEDELRWQRRRSFLTAHKTRMPETQLAMLSHLFTNIEFLCLQQPAELMRNIVPPSNPSPNPCPKPTKVKAAPPPHLGKKARKALRAEQQRLRQLAPLKIQPKEAKATQRAQQILATIAPKRLLVNPAFAGYPAKPKPAEPLAMLAAKAEPDLRLLLNRSSGASSSGLHATQQQVPPPPPLLGRRRSHSPITFDLPVERSSEPQSPAADRVQPEEAVEIDEPEAKRTKVDVPELGEALSQTPERSRLSVRVDLIDRDLLAAGSLCNLVADPAATSQSSELRVTIDNLSDVNNNHEVDDASSSLDDVIYVNTFPSDVAEPQQQLQPEQSEPHPEHLSFFTQTPESVLHFRSLLLLDYSRPDTADRSYSILRQTADCNRVAMMMSFKKQADKYVCKVNLDKYAALSTEPTAQREHAKQTACDQLLRQLQRLFYTIQSKPPPPPLADSSGQPTEEGLLIDADFIHRTLSGDRLSPANRGFRMLCQLGWSGGALGGGGSSAPGCGSVGIEEPIAVRQQLGHGRRGLGSAGQPTIDQITPPMLHLFEGVLLDFVADESNVAEIRVQLAMTERCWKQLGQLAERSGLRKRRIVVVDQQGQHVQQMVIEKCISPADMADNIAWGGVYATRFNLWPPLCE